MIAAVLPALVRAATQEPSDEFDPDTVTPGIWGFVLTFVIMGVGTPTYARRIGQRA